MVPVKGKKSLKELRFVLKRDNPWLNNFQLDILVKFRANMDCQFVCNPHGVASYATGKYISKADEPDKKMLHARILKSLSARHGEDTMTDRESVGQEC